MAKFPETIVPNYTLQLIPKWRTLQNALGDNFEQRTAKQTYPQFDVTVNFSAMPDHSDVMVLWDFFQARKGAYESFYIYDPQLHAATYPAHTGLYIGTGDGTTDVFDIPGRSTSSQSIYVDDVVQTITTDYTIDVGTGSESADQVDFVTAPTAGEIITCDFTGIMRIPVRFKNDRLTFELFEASIYRTGAIELFGLRFG